MSTKVVFGPLLVHAPKHRIQILALRATCPAGCYLVLMKPVLVEAPQESENTYLDSFRIDTPKMETKTDNIL